MSPFRGRIGALGYWHYHQTSIFSPQCVIFSCTCCWFIEVEKCSNLFFLKFNWYTTLLQGGGDWLGVLLPKWSQLPIFLQLCCTGAHSTAKQYTREQSWPPSSLWCRSSVRLGTSVRSVWMSSACDWALTEQWLSNDLSLTEQLSQDSNTLWSYSDLPADIHHLQARMAVNKDYCTLSYNSLCRVPS